MIPCDRLRWWLGCAHDIRSCWPRGASCLNVILLTTLIQLVQFFWMLPFGMECLCKRCEMPVPEESIIFHNVPFVCDWSWSACGSDGSYSMVVVH